MVGEASPLRFDQGAHFRPWAHLRPSQYSLWAIAAIALTALLGWIFDLRLLTSWAPGTPTLKPMTAFCFLALVLALWAADSGRLQLTAGLGWAAGSMAALSLVQDLSHVDLGIDSWIATRLGAIATGPGTDTWRMASATAVMFIIGSAATACLGDQRRFWLVPVLAGIMGLLAACELIVLAIVGPAYVSPPPAFSSVALPTIVASLLLASNLLPRHRLDLAALVQRSGLNFGIGGWLLALVVAAVLPVLLFAGIAAQRLAVAERQATLDELQQRTEAAAQTVERYLRSMQETATALANNPDVLLQDLRIFYAFAESAAIAGRGDRAVSVVAPDGRQLLNTRMPYGTPLPAYGDLASLAQTIAKRTPIISDLFTGVVIKRTLFSVTVPVIRDGHVTSIIAVGSEPQDLTATLLEMRLPRGWIGTLLDRKGVIVARTHDPEKWLGRVASRALIAARAKGHQGAYPGLTSEGITTSSFFVNLPGSGWTMEIGVPTSQLEGPVQGTIRFMIALGLASLFIAAGLAFVLGRHMHQQVEGIADAAKAVGDGRAVMIAPSSVQELDEVAHALSSTRGLIKAREEALRAAHDSFRHLVEHSPFGVYAVDADFRLVLVSDGAQKVFENVRPLIGRDFTEVIHAIWPEPFADEVIGHFRRTLETGDPYHSPGTVERRQDIGDVESYDWKIERVTLPDGRFGLVCHFYDLTERLAHEAALRESEGRLRFALEAAHAGAWEIVVETGSFTASDQALALHGLPPGTPMTHELALAAVHPDDRPKVLAAIESTLKSGIPFRLEIRIPQADGSIRWIESKAMRSDDHSRLIGLSQDITERKRAEEHKALLMGELNHRAKNLLAVVQAIARMTARKSEPRLFVERFSERLASLAASQDLLVKSKWQGADLRELVRSNLAHFADLVGSRIVLDGPSLQLTPEATQTIGMAMHELATNAGKYGALSNAGGSVRIGWRIMVDDGSLPRFQINWSEHGGPLAAPPERRGFGYIVLVDMVARGLNAEVSLTYPPSGLVWQLAAAAESVCVAPQGPV